MGYFKSLEERKNKRTEIYNRAIKASDTVLTGQRTNLILFDAHAVLAHYREFLIEGRKYGEEVDRMNWLEWFLYGDTVRKEAKILAARARDVQDCIVQLKFQ